MLKNFSVLLRHRLSLPLPGREAQLKMAHAERKINPARFKIPQDVRWGSVLILLYADEHKIKLPLILRQTYDGVHSGQVALPGGKFEPADENLANTALREAGEEIGIRSADVEILGTLTELYIPPSNFLVHPHIGMIAYKPGFFPDATEVQNIIEISFDDLMNESLVDEKVITLSNGINILTPCYNFRNHAVWGATAMILSELKTVVKEIGVDW